ncbi:MAG: NAD(P)H-dependent oxidoreductase [Pseudomonadota bacterium]|nr:NAD(P)H-dependent oxidoreductase [Pseudomonadota bacterium]
MSQNILILNGNPKANSLSHALTAAYLSGLPSTATVDVFHLSDMPFDPNLAFGYNQQQPLEPHLLAFQHALLKADHLVMIFPIWWGGMPAQLKGLIDRTFLPNVAFKYQAGSGMPKQLLKGKTARLILTMDVPTWYYRWQGSPVIRQLNQSILGFCGFKQIKVTRFGKVLHSSLLERQGWLKQVKNLAANQSAQ